MYKKLESLFLGLAKYLTFDPKKYALEELFSDIKAFKDGLAVSDVINFFSWSLTWLKNWPAGNQGE